MEYGSIGLESTMRFSRVRGILIVKKENIVRFSKVKDKGLDACKNRFSDIYPLSKFLCLKSIITR